MTTDIPDFDISSVDTCLLQNHPPIPTGHLQEFTDNLTVLNLNIRSLHSNFDLLTSFLAQVGVIVKVIIITESFLDDDSSHLYNLNGYKKAYINRPSNGGGIIAYVHNSLEFSVISAHTGIFDTHEALSFSLKCPSKIDINFFCIYRPPNLNLVAFAEYLNSLSRRVLKKNCLFIGDLNVCPVRDASSAGFRALENFFVTKNFRQLVEFPTYHSYDGNPSTLDHIWCNMPFKSSCLVFSTPIADHNPSVTSFDIRAKFPDIKIKFRDFSEKRMKLFQENFPKKFENFCRELFCSFTPLDEKFKFLSDWLAAVCDHFFPIRTKTISHKRFISPWLNSRIIKLINKKHVLFSLFKAGEITYESYSIYLKGLKLLLRLSESAYHRRRLSDYKHNVRKKWGYLNNLLGRLTADEIIEL